MPTRLKSRLPVRIWNTLAASRGLTSGNELTVHDLCNLAGHDADSAAFGAPTFRKPLAKLVHALNAAPNHHAFGRFLIRRVLVELLRNRLFLEQAWRERPDVLKSQVREPVIIVGLQRSGTTLLFNLLCAGRRFRFLENWETSRPAGPSGSLNASPTLRRAATRLGLAVQYYLTPELRNIHESRATGPEECTTLLMLEFASQAFTVLGHIPDYLEWLEGYDYRATQHYHRRTIQLLQAGSELQWIMKSPNHLPALDALLETYPDAKIVHLHRDPCVVIPSCTNLLEAYRSTFCESVDRPSLGREVMHLARDAVERAMLARARHPTRRIVDVQYVDLVGDPVKTACEICEALDLSLPSDTLRDFKRVARRPRPRTSQYSLRKYDLSAELVRERLAEYAERYHVQPEPSAP